MRFTSFIVAGVCALGAAAQSSTPSMTTSAAPQVTDKVTKCLDACDPADVTCKANCITVPSPDNSNVNATTDCVANCDQGKGTAADNQAYGECVQQCIDTNFYTSGGLNPTGTAGTTGGGSSAAPTTATFTSDGQTYTSTSTPKATGSGSNSDDSGNGSDDSGSDSDNDTGAAGMVTVGSSVGLLALFAGMLAL